MLGLDFVFINVGLLGEPNLFQAVLFEINLAHFTELGKQVAGIFGLHWLCL